MSIYRNTLFFAKGMIEFTRGGYQSSSKSFIGSDTEVDCSGQIFMVTGANSGIGKAISIDLAKKGGTVHMICRNASKAETAKQSIIEQTGNQNIHIHILDLSEPRQVYKFATDFCKSNDSLRVLVNNAGAMINERETNSEGLERNFAVNTLGVHILTTGLVPLLSKSVEPRVVTISSGSMLLQKLDVTDLQFERTIPFDGTMVYAQTKRHQVVMTERYAEKHPGIHFSCINPGWVSTPMSQFPSKMQPYLRTPEQGADTALWLAVSSTALRHPSGLFFLDRKPTTTHLPLAWTRSTIEEENKFMSILDEFLEKFKN